MRLYSCFTLMLLLAALLTACGKTKAEPAASSELPALTPDGFAFPAPSTLAHATSGPPQNSQRYLGAKTTYGSGWPSNRVDNLGIDLTMTPQWDPLLPDLADAAYATYRFDSMAGYNGKKRIKLKWNQVVPAKEDVFVGLVNVTRDRWDWFRINANNEAYFTAPFSDYIDSSERLMVVVMVLSSQVAHLDSVLVGDSYIQTPGIGNDLDIDPTKNVAPLTVNFTGFATPIGSVITSMDWDWDSDGTYDLIGQADASHIYPAGEHTVTLRATDAEGNTATASKTFLAINPNNLSPTASFVALDPTSGTAPLAIDFDASGSSDPDGTIISYEWDFNGLQGFEFESTDPLSSFVFGRKGQVSVILRVTDNDLETATFSLNVNVTTGWSTVLIDGGVDIWDASSGSRGLDLATFGSATKRAGVAYHDRTADTLHFARASADNGSTWQAPIQPIVGNDRGFSPRLVARIDGVPLIAYGQETAVNTYSQLVISATSDTGAVWNAPVAVATGTMMGWEGDLAIINTLPAIVGKATGLFANGNELKYVLASNAQGTAWHDPVTILTSAGINYSEPQLTAVGSGAIKRPAIVYGHGFDLAYMRAEDVDGSAWPDPTLFNSPDYYLAFSLVNGNPAWIGGVHSLTNPTLGLQYCRASDATGSTWPVPTVIGTGGNADLVIHDGKPVAVFCDLTFDGVQLAYAQDADGAAWDAPFFIVSEEGADQARATVVNGNLVIVYNNEDTKQLRAAYWN